MIRGRLPVDQGLGSVYEPLLLDRSALDLIAFGDPTFSVWEEVHHPVVVRHPNAPDRPEVWFVLGVREGKAYRIELWACPDQLGLDRERDCTRVLSDAVTLTDLQAADLDGDGWLEVVASGIPAADAPPQLQVYDHERNVRATITGPDGDGLGTLLHVAADGDDTMWLLAGTAWQVEPVEAHLYAFRGPDLQGSLTEASAERVYVTEGIGNFGDVEVYRATEGGEPILLLGAYSQIFQLPFAPGAAL